MSQAKTQCNPTHTIVTLSASEIQSLADRLYGRAVSTLSTSSAQEQRDLVTASRALRRLLATYEREAGRPLHTIMLCGGGSN